MLQCTLNKQWVWFFSAWKSLEKFPKVWKPVRMFMLHFCCSFPPTRAYKLFLKQMVFYNLLRLNQNYIILSRMSRQWHVFCMCFNIPKDFLEGIHLACWIPHGSQNKLQEYQDCLGFLIASTGLCPKSCSDNKDNLMTYLGFPTFFMGRMISTEMPTERPPHCQVKVENLFHSCLSLEKSEIHSLAEAKQVTFSVPLTRR